MTISNLSLIDTNVLVYAADETSDFHQASRKLREKALIGEISLSVCPQVLNEFYAIVTDPKRVDMPISYKEARLEIEKYFYSRNILKIYAKPGVMEIILDLLKRYKIKRQNIFDAQLVATMLANGVTRLYTYNQDHCAEFKEIEVLRP